MRTPAQTYTGRCSLTEEAGGVHDYWQGVPKSKVRQWCGRCSGRMAVARGWWAGYAPEHYQTPLRDLTLDQAEQLFANQSEARAWAARKCAQAKGVGWFTTWISEPES